VRLVDGHGVNLLVIYMQRITRTFTTITPRQSRPTPAELSFPRFMQ